MSISSSLRCRAGLALVVASLLLTALTPVVGPPAATAQNVAGHSDWAPFIGEYQMWCTASTGAPGPCNHHHNGWAIDIDVPWLDPVYAAGPGVVIWTETGCAPEGMDGGCNTRAGNYVAVDHGDHVSRYIHLASFADGIEIGTPIAGGQLIGYSGASGTSDGGVHLHYDEINKPISTTRRIFFGPMLACHGSTRVQYPDILGTTDWQQVPHGTVLRNDGYECLGGAATRPTPPPASPVSARPGGAVGLAFGDFDNDGHDDLVVGAPGEGIRARDAVGTTAVVHGGPAGLTSTTQGLRSKAGLKGAPEAGDMLGAAVATGDFDCDRRDDLAIGAPGEDIAGQPDAGAVIVAYGGARGVSRRNVLFRQAKWLPGQLEAGDLTGASLVAGDFNGDGCDDLAVGAPGEDIGAFTDAGAVMVIYGGSGGFGPGSATSGVLYQDGGLAGITESGDNVGATLAAGDFDCDGNDDLAVGSPSESIDASSRAGAVSVVFGTSAGIGSETITLYQSSGLAGILEAGDRASAALAAGDFNGDGCDDLAVGAPGEDLSGGSEAGAVSVAFGSRNGFADSSVHFQDDGGLRDRIEGGDLVGAALAVVDLNCDGIDDLAVGAPGEDIAGRADAGWVGVLRGSRAGINGSITTLFQRKGGLRGSNDPGDLTGTALAGGFINSDSCGDLVIGIPGETIRGRAEAGRVVVVLGAPDGVRSISTHSQRKNLPGRSEAGDLLGGPGVWRLLGLSLQ